MKLARLLLAALVAASTLAQAAQFDLGTAGVRLSDDGDGGITFLGLGDGSDENLILNLDDTANTGVFSSSTGLNLLNFSGIGLQADSLTLGTALSAANGGTGITALGTGVATALGQSSNSGSGFVTGTGTVSLENKDLTNANNTLPCEIQVAASDETTAITAATNKIKFRMPYAMTVTGVRASLSTAQASGSIFTVDINEGGTSIISTKLTIDNTELTSTTAATAPVISDSALADDAEMSVDVDQIGAIGAAGLKVTLIGTR